MLACSNYDGRALVIHKGQMMGSLSLSHLRSTLPAGPLLFLSFVSDFPAHGRDKQWGKILAALSQIYGVFRKSLPMQIPMNLFMMGRDLN